MRPFVYEGDDGDLFVQEGGFVMRGFSDGDDVDVIGQAAGHFAPDPSAAMLDDVKLGRFRVTIEKL